MTTAMISSFSRVINPLWLTGPILDKELRVASRRRRNYALRSAYLLLLITLVAVAWSTALLRSSGNFITWQVSRMAEVGRNLIITITWFQFVAAQILAAVMLSNSIGDEVRRGTMDVLMTTPVNCIQIVLGKLFSKLFQLILLLAVSLPLLAFVRVFGGIQWDYIVSALSITLTATIFVGSLSMFLSIKVRRSYLVILTITIFLVIAYILTTSLMFAFGNSNSTLLSIILHINPFAAMVQIISTAFPGSRLAATSFSLPLHCLVMGGASIFILFASAFRMRRRALESFLRTDGKKKLHIWKRNFITSVLKSKSSLSETRSIRPVTGSPIIWKELPKPFAVSLRTNAIVFGILSLILFLFYYLAYLFNSFSGGPPTAMIFCSTFTRGLWLIASIRTVAMAATSITKEKETRTLPILLGTLLEPKQIIHGKALAAVWRNAPVWLVLALGEPVFYILMITLQNTGGTRYTNCYNYYYIITRPLTIVAYVAFLIGLGMYFSVRLKSSTVAIIAAIGSLLGLHVIRQFLFLLLFAVFDMTMIRNIQITSLLNQFLVIVFYAVIGLVLLRRAKYRLRLNIF